MHNTAQPTDELRPSVLTHQAKRLKQMLARLGVFYIVSILIGVVAIIVFLWLADEVLEREFTLVNTTILLWIHQWTNPVLTHAAFFFTDLGSTIGTTCIGVALVGWYLYTKHPIKASATGVLLVGGVLLTVVLKEYFKQIRPNVFHPLTIESSFSFPSGHTLIAFCLWGFIAVRILMDTNLRWYHWLLAIAAVLVAALIAASRMYLGVHWPTDVLAGILVAAFWLSTCMIAERWFIQRAVKRKGAGVRN